ncbi:hypothetical protein [[Kitasatospora] papulosa]|uniref:hypothetical protein n=1 Tax=[Kitasatospora] papulosa TaxID=1464011 RepID=UPI00371F3DCD
MRLRTLAEVVDHLGATGRSGIIIGTEILVRRPAVGRKDRDNFISGKNKQNTVKAMGFTVGGGGAVLQPDQTGSCADITHARESGLVRLAVEILADAGHQGLGAQIGGRVVTPPHRKFERTYHRRRRQASLGRLAPVECETVMTAPAYQAALPHLPPNPALDPNSSEDGERSG